MLEGNGWRWWSLRERELCWRRSRDHGNVHDADGFDAMPSHSTPTCMDLQCLVMIWSYLSAIKVRQSCCLWSGWLWGFWYCNLFNPSCSGSINIPVLTMLFSSLYPAFNSHAKVRFNYLQVLGVSTDFQAYPCDTRSNNRSYLTWQNSQAWRREITDSYCLVVSSIDYPP